MLLTPWCAGKPVVAEIEIESASVFVLISRVLATVLPPQAFNSMAEHCVPTEFAAQRVLESILIFPAPTLNSVAPVAPVAITPRAG